MMPVHTDCWLWHVYKNIFDKYCHSFCLSRHSFWVIVNFKINLNSNICTLYYIHIIFNSSYTVNLLFSQVLQNIQQKIKFFSWFKCFYVSSDSSDIQYSNLAHHEITGKKSYGIICVIYLIKYKICGVLSQYERVGCILCGGLLEIRYVDKNMGSISTHCRYTFLKQINFCWYLFFYY